MLVRRQGMRGRRTSPTGETGQAWLHTGARPLRDRAKARAFAGADGHQWERDGLSAPKSNGERCEKGITPQSNLAVCKDARRGAFKLWRSAFARGFW